MPALAAATHLSPTAPGRLMKTGTMIIRRHGCRALRRPLRMSKNVCLSVPRLEQDEGLVRPRASLRIIGVTLIIVGVITSVVPQGTALASGPQGVWLMDSKVAVQIFDCSNLLCGRILWLQIPRDPQGHLDRDKNNPDPTLRQRPLCGLTILWGLHSAGPDRWKRGWFYNPDDGKTYNVSARLGADDVIVARIYRTIQLFGETKTLHRVSHGTSEGWC
jgi:uncharacterized protein (DUF2147 family)